MLARLSDSGTRIIIAHICKLLLDEGLIFASMIHTVNQHGLLEFTSRLLSVDRDHRRHR